MSQVTPAKRTVPFAQVAKTLLDDPRLSWAAKGIASYLVGKPDGWKMRISDLEKHSCDGKHLIRAAINELRALGYARFSRTREGGKIQEGVWEISDTPDFAPRSENQEVEPRSDFQEEENQEKGNQHHSKNDSNENDCYQEREQPEKKAEKQSLNTSSKTHPPIAPYPLPERMEALRPDWERWQEHRREIKKPLTRQSARAQIELLDSMTHGEARECINYSINGGYPSLYRPRKDRHAHSGPRQTLL